MSFFAKFMRQQLGFKVNFSGASPRSILVEYVFKLYNIYLRGKPRGIKPS